MQSSLTPQVSNASSTILMEVSRTLLMLSQNLRSDPNLSSPCALEHIWWYPEASSRYDQTVGKHDVGITDSVGTIDSSVSIVIDD